MISPVEERDLDELKDLIAVVVCESVADNEEDATFLIDDIVLSLNTWWTSGSKGFHAKYSVDNAIVGFVIVKEYCLLSHLFVLPQHQGHGIGRELLENAIGACRGKNPSGKIGLNSSNNASGFYAAMGFRQTGPGIEKPGGCIPYEYDLQKHTGARPFMKRKTIVCASVLLAVCTVLIVGYFALWRDTSVTVYNDTFKILDYHMSFGMYHKFSDGNQTIDRIKNRIKNRLKSTFGLKFTDPPRLLFTVTGPESLVLYVRYTGDLPFDELDGLEAIVRNDEDFFREMGDGNRYDRDKQIFQGCFVSGNLPENDGSLRIDFYLSSDYDEPIASLKVGELNKYNK